MQPIEGQDLEDFLDRLIAEDLGAGDVTSNAVIDEGATLSAHMVARAALVAAGLELAAALFSKLAPGAAVDLLVADGDLVPAGGILMNVAGNGAPQSSSVIEASL